MIPRACTIALAVLILSGCFASMLFGQNMPHGPLEMSCAVCHDGGFDAMRPDSDFDHRTTGFPLEGQHRSLACAECHTDLVFPGTSRECAVCHDDVHNGELGGDCARCHTPATFAVVDDFTGFHYTTRFPLRGAHRTVACIDCHDDGMERGWRGMSAACVECHYDDYVQTTAPDHRDAGIPVDCALCHDEEPGFRLIYDHGLTGFELTGAHVVLECVECHGGGLFGSLPSACWQCHIDDYHATTEPDHAAAGYSQDCALCHDTAVWAPATTTAEHLTYPLEGAHLSADCAACHPGGQYLGTPRDCAACHQDDYDSAAIPDHRVLQFPVTCEDCHTANGWAPSLFDHDATAFPRTGAHQSLACSACHTVQTGIAPPTECIGCHGEDYARAPEHESLAFPTDCMQCHGTVYWDPPQFSHTEFPIYTGQHRQKWSACADCHQAPGAFTEFTCFTCHSPNIHDEFYTSAECYQCHPDGRE